MTLTTPRHCEHLTPHHRERSEAISLLLEPGQPGSRGDAGENGLISTQSR